MKHVLYRLEKINIAFESYYSINAKLCQSTFNYPKFLIINHFVQYIRNYGSAVNYDTVHSKVAHKYLLKTSYNKTIKKEYNLQIYQYIIAIKDIIAVAKNGRKNVEQLAIENLLDKTVIAKVAKC